MVATTRGVKIGPGQIALTLIPRSLTIWLETVREVSIYEKSVSKTLTSPRERHNSSLGRGVVHELGVTYERVNTGVVDDTGAPRHHRDESLGEVEDGVNVGLEDVFPLFVRQIEDGFDFVLGTGVVEEDVDLAVENLLGLFGDGRAFFLVAQIRGNCFKLGRGAVFLEVGSEVVHVLLLLLDVVQE